LGYFGATFTSTMGFIKKLASNMMLRETGPHNDFEVRRENWRTALGG